MTSTMPQLSHTPVVLVYQHVPVWSCSTHSAAAAALQSPRPRSAQSATHHKRVSGVQHHASGARKERHSSPMLYLLHREPRLQVRVVQRIIGSQQHLLRRLVQVVHHKVPLWRPQRHNGSVELLSFSLTPRCAPCLLALCCSLASSVTQSHVLMVLQPGLVVPAQQRGGEARRGHRNSRTQLGGRAAACGAPLPSNEPLNQYGSDSLFTLAAPLQRGIFAGNLECPNRTPATEEALDVNGGQGAEVPQASQPATHNRLESSSCLVLDIPV